MNLMFNNVWDFTSDEMLCFTRLALEVDVILANFYPLIILVKRCVIWKMNYYIQESQECCIYIFIYYYNRFTLNQISRKVPPRYFIQEFCFKLRKKLARVMDSMFNNVWDFPSISDVFFIWGLYSSSSVYRIIFPIKKRENFIHRAGQFEGDEIYLRRRFIYGCLFANPASFTQRVANHAHDSPMHDDPDRRSD